MFQPFSCNLQATLVYRNVNLIVVTLVSLMGLRFQAYKLAYIWMYLSDSEVEMVKMLNDW
jgi:hypothetical protein